MLDTILTDIGLTPEQVDVYGSLLKHGNQSAIGLSKTTKVKRTYVYRICEELIGKGLAKVLKEGRTTLFAPLSPDLLLDQAQTKRIQLDQTILSLENILPTLKSQYQLVENKPVVTYYEGVEGIKKVYLDTIKEGKPILALVETSHVQDDVYQWVTAKYADLRIQNNIPARVIVASGEKTKTYLEKNEQELRETKVISNAKYPLAHEINIYGNKVAILNHHQDDQLVGIIIDHPLIASTFKSWFELTWTNI